MHLLNHPGAFRHPGNIALERCYAKLIPATPSGFFVAPEKRSDVKSVG